MYFIKGNVLLTLAISRPHCEHFSLKLLDMKEKVPITSVDNIIIFFLDKYIAEQIKSKLYLIARYNKICFFFVVILMN